MKEVDQILLNFNPESLFLLNIILSIVMYGVALDIKLADFKEVLKSPKGPIVGLVAQFLLLPAATYLLTMWIKPMPSIALGMMLVAACPGGNVSNFITHLAKGNTALSITMTAISTSVAIIMTPFNIWFWSSLNPSVAPIYKKVQLDPGEMFLTIFILLGIPLVLGLLTQKFLPNLASKMAKYFKFFSIIIFAFFVIAALYANFDYFIKYIGIVAVVVMIHNATAIGLGYVSGKLMRLNFKDTRAIAIEVGIQNSALALILIFNFFNGLGGMALIAAWWGVWHLIVGLSLATIWSRYDNKKE